MRVKHGLDAERNGVTARRAYWKNLRFVLFFTILFLAFDLAYYWSRDTVVERVLIDRVTVMPSAFFINAIKPDENVSADGHRLVSPNVRLSVLNGCEGTEAILLLVSAIVAFGAKWKSTLFGIVCGTVLLYAINQGRIVALYYALRHDQKLFDMLHGYVGPTLIIVIAGLFFVGWVSYAQYRGRTPSAFA